MSVRESRGRRNLPFDIDLGDLRVLGEALGATADQMRLAYSRALNRTVQTSAKLSAQLMRREVGIKNIRTVKRRALAFSHKRESARELGGMELFFGLNAIRLSELAGRVPGSITPRHDLRDPVTGRYIDGESDASSVRFIPRGKALKEKTFDDSYIGENRKGAKTIYVRGERGRRREAEMDIYDPMLNQIEDEIFQEIPALFLHHYEVDLRGRVAAGIHTSLRGKRS